MSYLSVSEEMTTSKIAPLPHNSHFVFGVVNAPERFMSPSSEAIKLFWGYHPVNPCLCGLFLYLRENTRRHFHFCFSH